jgi:hypothetical protein
MQSHPFRRAAFIPRQQGSCQGNVFLLGLARGQGGTGLTLPFGFYIHHSISAYKNLTLPLGITISKHNFHGLGFPSTSERCSIS